MIASSLRFCMVTTFYPPYNFGGDGIFVYRLSNELARRGHTVDVVHCVDAYDVVRYGHAAPRVEDYPNHPNVTTHPLRATLGPLSPLITHQTGRAGLKAASLRAVVSGTRHDVIHFHNMSLIGLDALAYGDGIKLLTMHEHWLVCPLHTLWKFNRAPCDRKQCIPCSIHARRPPQLWRYTEFPQKMLRHVDAFIAMSQFSLSQHLAMGLHVDAPLVHLPPFVPLQYDALGITASPHPKPYFLFVGRLERMKGVQVLIEAFPEQKACDLLIAGEGTYEPELRRLADGAPNIVFLGRVSSDSLQPYLRHAIALLVPSVGYETFGTVILEAFAWQTPVIAHRLGPLPEIVAESGGGLLYDDVTGLAAAMDALRTDEDRRRELGHLGHRAFLERWTAERHLTQYLELIDQIAGNRLRQMPRPQGMA